MNASPEPAQASREHARTDAPLAQVDFDRPLVSILGLPFDAIGLDEAVRRVRDAAFAGKRCFVSTPNLNFAIAARSDPQFRGSVLRSDLCLIDGMPLVWIARLFGLPVRERVSGADLFGALMTHPGPPLTVFLFGGPEGAAARASDEINRRQAGVRCVGVDTAGFGSIESMSTDAQIARINASGAQFVVVSLGAKKGQAWIEHNAARLAAPLLSHLGAVVNFAAGTLRRAPRWMQRSGLEWLWRVKEEPALWRRYGSDGRAALILLLTRVLPDARASRAGAGPVGSAPRLVATDRPDRSELRLEGGWRDDQLAPLRAALAHCAERRQVGVTIDLSGVTGVGVGGVGLLLIAQAWFSARGGFTVLGTSPGLTLTLRRQMVSEVLLGIE